MTTIGLTYQDIGKVTENDPSLIARLIETDDVNLIFHWEVQLGRHNTYEFTDVRGVEYQVYRMNRKIDELHAIRFEGNAHQITVCSDPFGVGQLVLADGVIKMPIASFSQELYLRIARDYSAPRLDKLEIHGSLLQRKYHSKWPSEFVLDNTSLAPETPLSVVCYNSELSLPRGMNFQCHSASKELRLVIGGRTLAGVELSNVSFIPNDYLYRDTQVVSAYKPFMLSLTPLLGCQELNKADRQIGPYILKGNDGLCVWGEDILV